MVERRSLGDALSMSPETVAFINGGDEKSAGGTDSKTTRTIELPKSEGAADKESSGRSPSKRQRLQPRSGVPSADDVLDQVLVPLNTRLPHGLSNALRRVCLEQRLSHAKPDSIQEIVEMAIEEWLAKRRR
jgi:hypothetical protein